MNKDALLATAIGFVIGLCITGLLLVGPSVLKMMPKLSLQLPKIAQNKPKDTKKADVKPVDFAFTIDSPIHESIESNDEILVSGTTLPQATVILQGASDDIVVESNTSGKYAGKISLVEGRNVVTVTSYLKDKQSTKSITVYYTPETL